MCLGYCSDVISMHRIDGIASCVVPVVVYTGGKDRIYPASLKKLMNYLSQVILAQVEY